MLLIKINLRISQKLGERYFVALIEGVCMKLQDPRSMWKISDTDLGRGRHRGLVYLGSTQRN
jgi:hypothetical protein